MAAQYPDYGMTPQAGGFLPYVNPIAGVLGVASNAYGSYLQSQQADKQYEESMRRYNEEVARQKQMDLQTQQQQSLQNSLSTGQYARNLSNDIENPYIAYSKALGR